MLSRTSRRYRGSWSGRWRGRRWRHRRVLADPPIFSDPLERLFGRRLISISGVHVVVATWQVSFREWAWTSKVAIFEFFSTKNKLFKRCFTFVCLSACFPASLPACLPVSQPTCLPFCLSVWQYVSLFVRLSICLSVRLIEIRLECRRLQKCFLIWNYCLLFMGPSLGFDTK
jgi:hypothetical protein